MNRLPKCSCLAVLAILILASPTWARAQTASEHFPNDDGSANVQVGGTMNLILKVQNLLGPVQTADVGGVVLSVGETGQEVAVDASRQLCRAARLGPLAMVCDDPTCTFPLGATKTITCTKGSTGFSITRINTQTNFTVSPSTTNKIQALNCRTPSGNTHGNDPLRRMLVRLDPNGVNGSVTFRVHHFQGSQNPRRFTVNTTGLSDLALHNAIRDGYNGLGLGLTAVTAPPTGCFFSFDPAVFPGNLVEVTYSLSTQSTLQDFEVDGLRSGTTLGQIITMETAGCAPPLPPVAQCPIDNLTFMANSKTTLEWTFPGTCLLTPSYDVVKGGLDCHCSSCATSLLCNVADTTVTDNAMPLPGQGFWYLVRMHGGTWNSTDTGQCANHDPALSLCP